jgi:hypothetical protein
VKPEPKILFFGKHPKASLSVPQGEQGKNPVPQGENSRTGRRVYPYLKARIPVPEGEFIRTSRRENYHISLKLKAIFNLQQSSIVSNSFQQHQRYALPRQGMVCNPIYVVVVTRKPLWKNQLQQWTPTKNH